MADKRPLVAEGDGPVGVEPMEAGPPLEVSLVSLRQGFTNLIPVVGTSVSIRQMREKLAEHLKLPRDGLDAWKEEICVLMKKALAEQGTSSAGSSTDPAPQATIGDGQNLAEPPKKLWKRHFFGTWSHTEGIGKKAPQDIAKADFGAMALRMATELFQKATEPPKKAKLNQVLKLSVWAEPHKKWKDALPLSNLGGAPLELPSTTACTCGPGRRRTFQLGARLLLDELRVRCYAECFAVWKDGS